MALPLGELSPKVTERAHAVSPVAEVLGAMRNLPAAAKKLPLRGSWHRVAMTERVQPACTKQKFSPAAPPLPQEAGAANAVDRYDPTRENAKPERPQTLRLCSIKNILSAIYAQSNAERI